MSDSSARNLKTVIEAAGAGAVLLGLIFVGLEVKQNTAAMQAATIQGLADSSQEQLLLLRCQEGDLLPLSDFGGQGASIHYKAWVCSNPDCGFNIKIRNGDVYLNEPIASGAMHAPRVR